MKKSCCFLCLIVLFSCTSNTIFKKPKDLIPRDTMGLLIQEMFIASSAKNSKNIHLEKNINYMPFVYETFKIDSIRFQTSNFYYMTKIDLYQEILTDVKNTLEAKKEKLASLKKELDSIKKDSIEKLRVSKPNVSSKNRKDNKISKEYE